MSLHELTFTCPVCGADVPRKAKSCPECGACEKSGWSEDQYLDGLNLPDESSDRPTAGSSRQRIWQIVAVIVLVAWLVMLLSGRW